MTKLFALALAALSSIASAGPVATVTPGVWDLYKGSSIAKDASGHQLRDFASLEICADAAELQGKKQDYTCRTRAAVSVKIEPDVPPTPIPVDCVAEPVTSSSDWAPSVCPSTSKQTRTVTTTWHVTTAPSNGGKACPATPAPVLESRDCAYVPPVDPNPPTPGAIIVAAGETITAGINKANPGATVIVKPGTYAAFSLKACTAAAWCTLKAETDGTVNITGLSIPRGDWFWRFEGLKFTGSSPKSIVGSYWKFFRTGFFGAPATGNDSTLQIGTNNYTPGASNGLIEDSWVGGLGGRYKALVYNSSKIVLRRVVVRHDGGWSATDGNPQGGFSLYDSSDVTCQDCVFVQPSATGLVGFEAAIYLVSNGTGIRQANVSLNGAIVIGSPNNGVAAEGHGANTVYNVQDVAVIGSTQGGFNTNNGSHTLNVTRGYANVKGAPYAAWSGTVKASACVYKGTNSSASLTNCSTVLPASIIVPNANGQGANIQKRIGVSGTLFGEPGFDAVQGENLWPWPNQDRLKAEFDAIRPAFDGKSFTDYIQSQK